MEPRLEEGYQPGGFRGWGAGRHHVGVEAGRSRQQFELLEPTLGRCHSNALSCGPLRSRLFFFSPSRCLIDSLALPLPFSAQSTRAEPFADIAKLDRADPAFAGEPPVASPVAESGDASARFAIAQLDPSEEPHLARDLEVQALQLQLPGRACTGAQDCLRRIHGLYHPAVGPASSIP